MLQHFMGRGVAEKTEPPFHSRMSLQPERSIILLGAGASAGAGCPIMRGFIDLATDFLAQDKFTESEAIDVRATLSLYRAIRRSFSITEEDVENVETILSLANLQEIVGKGAVLELSTPGIANSVRSFIERVITKSGRVSSPNSAHWLDSSPSFLVYRQLVQALSQQKDKVTIITLNYDCLFEYTCYCLGVQFTYNRDLGDGIEILKLHGSVNWVRCSSEGCNNNSMLHISPLEYVASDTNQDEGYIDRRDKNCPLCGSKYIPVIIPPTWAKNIDEKFIKPSWSRSLELLQQCESFVTSGFSLPVSDSHVRHLLHLGFSSGKLRQALAILGSDADSAERWSRFFRETWRTTRFEVRNRTFAESVTNDIYPALVVNASNLHPPNSYFLLPPLSVDTIMKNKEAINSAIENGTFSDEEKKSFNRNILWPHVCGQIRENLPVEHESTRKYIGIIKKAGVLWTPTGEILPSHRNQF